VSLCEVKAPVRSSVVGAAALKELCQSLRFLGTEADDSTWLAPWFLERVTHISDHRLSRGLPQALERSPTLPGRFQARCRALCACHQLWITHRAIPLKKVLCPALTPDWSQRGECRLR
jgi:hypothetical protein